MKKTLSLFLVICLVACQKKIPSTSQVNPLIQQAEIFFNELISKKLPINIENFRASQPKGLAWNKAEIKKLSFGTVVEVPITFQKKLYIRTDLSNHNLLDLSSLTKLVIFKDPTGVYHYQVLTLIPDSNAIINPNTFTGIVLSEDWSGNSLASPEKINASFNYSAASTHPIIDEAMNIQVCTEIDGYNYSPDDPEDGVAWSETTCTSYGLPSAGNGISSGISTPDYSALKGGVNTSIYAIQILPPTNPIGNIANYFSCFTNVGGTDHTYTATLAIEQPGPGTRTPWGLSGAGSSATMNPINVGHTWLILTETTAYGSTTRNVGFYPAGLITPWYPSNQGILNDDEATTYNIALTITINNAQFFNILNFLSQGNNTGYIYDLNTNNCTTFALNALRSGNVNIFTKPGIWTNGGGDDPGDLGEDLLSMPLSSNMGLLTVSNYHPNVGSCN